jgi:hypothetical protein
MEKFEGYSEKQKSLSLSEKTKMQEKLQSLRTITIK